MLMLSASGLGQGWSKSWGKQLPSCWSDCECLSWFNVRHAISLTLALVGMCFPSSPVAFAFAYSTRLLRDVPPPSHCVRCACDRLPLGPPQWYGFSVLPDGRHYLLGSGGRLI